MKRRSFLGGALAVLCAPLVTFRGLKRPEPKRPRTFTWTGRAGNHRWGDPRNWTPYGAPRAGDTFRIPGTDDALRIPRTP